MNLTLLFIFDLIYKQDPYAKNNINLQLIDSIERKLYSPLKKEFQLMTFQELLHLRSTKLHDGEAYITNIFQPKNQTGIVYIKNIATDFWIARGSLEHISLSLSVSGILLNKINNTNLDYYLTPIHQFINEQSLKQLVFIISETIDINTYQNIENYFSNKIVAGIFLNQNMSIQKELKHKSNLFINETNKNLKSANRDIENTIPQLNNLFSSVENVCDLTISWISLWMEHDKPNLLINQTRDFPSN